MDWCSGRIEARVEGCRFSMCIGTFERPVERGASAWDRGGHDGGAVPPINSADQRATAERIDSWGGSRVGAAGLCGRRWRGQAPDNTERAPKHGARQRRTARAAYPEVRLHSAAMQAARSAQPQRAQKRQAGVRQQ